MILEDLVSTCGENFTRDNITAVPTKFEKFSFLLCVNLTATQVPNEAAAIFYHELYHSQKFIQTINYSSRVFAVSQTVSSNISSLISIYRNVEN